MVYAPEILGGVVFMLMWFLAPDHLHTRNGNGRRGGLFGRWFRPTDSDEEVIKRIPLDKIFQNPYQPRRKFTQSEMEQLKRSIREYGVMVPIMVRKVPRGYELACGERRMRACRDLGMGTIPAIVKDLTTPQMVELALVENLVRSNLLPLEEADTYARLKKEFAVVNESELAAKMGISKDQAVRYGKLSSLPVILKKALITDIITEGHALSLSQIPNEKEMLSVLSELIEKKLTPEQLQERVNVCLATSRKD